MSNIVTEGYDTVIKSELLAPITLIPGAVGGMVLGVAIENRLTHQGVRDDGQARINELTGDNAVLAKYSIQAKASGDATAQAFLKSQSAGNSKEITSVRGNLPEGANTGEDVVAIGGGMIIGLVATAALVGGAQRLARSKLFRSQTPENVS